MKILKLFNKKKVCKKNRRKEFADRFKYAKLYWDEIFNYSFIEITKSRFGMTIHAVNESEKVAHLKDMDWHERFWYLAKFRKQGEYKFYYS